MRVMRASMAGLLLPQRRLPFWAMPQNRGRRLPMSLPSHAPAAQAAGLLARLRAGLDQASGALAQRCSRDGRLQPGALDALQVPSFELAWAAAELLAAETALARAQGELDARLALLFAADAIVSVLDRLDALFLDLGLDDAPLRALRGDGSWQALRQAALTAPALAAAGQAVAAAQGEVGLLALDEAHALAQDSFRRFSQQVVMPL